ncbi:esterase/lipase family protein [Neptunicella sp. SCSIO 80796]|uniref:esterase/lipase family protein n=1 Tax=Neptunicella plasticusilytica TaxID=3117012 RepID=UPI003A4DF528
MVLNICGCLVSFFMLSSCTYLKYASVQANYAQIQNAAPSQINLKHMLDRETFFVIGRTFDQSGKYADVSLAVAAYSDKYKRNERVDMMFFKGTGTHFGLNLPDGDYDLLIYADINGNHIFEQNETVGERKLSLSKTLYPQLIVNQIDIPLTASKVSARSEKIALPENVETKQSLYYPSGTIRTLDDPLFSQNMSTLGMYDPASFLENASTMFYALEEDTAHKIPIVFVHGINGTPRSFEPIIKRLDRNRYKPWFFYYPSGGDLDQLADFFYNIFLSGDVIPLGDMPLIVVAHSMGGVVVREAINKYKGLDRENTLKLFVTVASPLGGNLAAAAGEKHGLLVLPAWRDLNPDNRFIQQLYRQPLPEFVNHQLFYAYRNSNILKLGENSDGVVSLSSQLHPEAQKQANRTFGFDSGHVDILSNEKMTILLLDLIGSVHGIFSEQSMAALVDGGFEIQLSDNYSPTTRHLIHYAGKYLTMLVYGLIEPMQSQKHFILAAQGEVQATTDLEKEFIMFMQEYPALVDEVLTTKTEKN